MSWAQKDDGTVEIISAVRACEGGGWIPMITVNGREHWNWQRTGMDRRKAVAAANAWAKEEASRYIGDWSVVVKDRTRAPRRSR